MLSELTAEHLSTEHARATTVDIGATTSPTPKQVIMRRRIITLTIAYTALIICMTAGWHTWPLAVGLGLWVWGYRIHEDRLTLTNREIRALLNG